MNSTILSDVFTSARFKLSSLFLPAMAALVFLCVAAQPAYAHFPIVAANATCDSGVPVIHFTVTSWDTNPADPGGTNPAIDVTFDGKVVDTGAFSAVTNPPDQFSDSKPSPLATGTVDVQAVPEAPDIWGDGQFWPNASNIVTVQIPTNCSPGTGRFTGGGKQVAVNGVTITKGFEVDCDLHQPSNNLEINWSDSLGTHQFHMDPGGFYFASCTLNGPPNPPPAPVNTIFGKGTGRYDGAEGYTVEFTLVDNGEPGVGHDEIGFKVYLTANPAVVVLDTGGLNFITGGNVQAHVDQH